MPPENLLEEGEKFSFLWARKQGSHLLMKHSWANAVVKLRQVALHNCYFSVWNFRPEFHPNGLGATQERLIIPVVESVQFRTAPTMPNDAAVVIAEKPMTVREHLASIHTLLDGKERIAQVLLDPVSETHQEPRGHDLVLQSQMRERANLFSDVLARCRFPLPILEMPRLPFRRRHKGQQR